MAKQVRRTSSRKKAPGSKQPPSARGWRIEGYRLEVSRKAGVDPAAAIAVLTEAVASHRSELVVELTPEAQGLDR